MQKPIRAFMVNKDEQGFSAEVKTISMDDLPKADVQIKVHYSSVNYKDGLASIPNGKIVRSYPFIPGIDLAGVVVASADPRFREGDEVIATSYEIGVSHYGGYSEFAQVPGDWVVPLPKGLTLKEAMIFGTAGFTAALSVHRLEENGVAPEKGKVLVTGATGGVGSIAVSILAKRGYHVVASTGKESEHDYLYKLGAKEAVSREEVTGEKISALDKQLWQAAVDPVGGKTLAAILSKLHYNGSVAVSGLTGGTDVPTTVFPFILRGINLLGIDSVYCPMELRKVIWERLATDLKPDRLEDFIDEEISLDQLPNALSKILASQMRGRVIVRL
ncbi:acryloyl-CoA reductase [Brevibacillus choshinensis]|uniref:NADPH:quinone oxidoreductase family protein n=1 Tax=Brevibacillus choshinensis TaxID=54911 RepID=UPI002E1C42FC|nr:acryloyl-CoA reductase [Brevibacillus choshinensis]MED4584455.1 acryloyl-CoA reductase [Brevibacillus choshinensis]MED4751859.1 acryloyl-CoA reductase [Brevibacillus choshinensis]